MKTRASAAGPVLALLAGLAALVVGTAMGWDASLVDTLVTPPPIVRAALVAGAVVFAGWALARGIRRPGTLRA